MSVNIWINVSVKRELIVPYENTIPWHSGKIGRYLLPLHHRANCQEMLYKVAPSEAVTNQLHLPSRLLEQSVEQYVAPLAAENKDHPMLEFLKWQDQILIRHLQCDDTPWGFRRQVVPTSPGHFVFCIKDARIADKLFYSSLFGPYVVEISTNISKKHYTGAT